MNKWQYLPFWSEKHWERARLRQTSADFGRLRKTSDFFGRLRTSSGIFRNDHVVFKNPSTPRIKLSCLYLRKSWQVYISHQPNCKITASIAWDTIPIWAKKTLATMVITGFCYQLACEVDLSSTPQYLVVLRTPCDDSCCCWCDVRLVSLSVRKV